MEVWDVVDKGFSEQNESSAASAFKALFSGTRKSSQLEEGMVADASTVDVYRGTQACIMMYKKVNSFTALFQIV